MNSAAEIDHRAVQRHRTLKGGMIVFNHGQSSIDCTVRNLSDRGARLQVTSIMGIPDRFELVLANAPGKPCQVIWRKTTEIGVNFVDG
jgi:hypothetical protein